MHIFNKRIVLEKFIYCDKIQEVEVASGKLAERPNDTKGRLRTPQIRWRRFGKAALPGLLGQSVP